MEIADGLSSLTSNRDVLLYITGRKVTLYIKCINGSVRFYKNYARNVKCISNLFVVNIVNIFLFLLICMSTG